MQQSVSRVPVRRARTHVVTGGTGFVGSALILELLARTEGTVVAIARPKADQSPRERIQQTLEELIDGYELPSCLRHAVATRVTVIPGDIEQVSCGVTASVMAVLRGAEFWHCAASLQYMDRHREQIERTNVLGTTHVVQLARRSQSPMFNMVSTAYVAGSRRGDIPAEEPDIELVNNCYERSKVMAEEVVLSSGLAARILRPSIVIGHSRTHYSTSTDGLYGFIRNLTKFRNALERTQVGLASSLDVSIEVHAEGRVDLVPIDSVVEDAVGLSNAGAAPGYYHLTNSTPPFVKDAVTGCFELSGLATPHLVSNRETMSEVDLKLQQRIDFYSSYLINPKRFDRASVEGVLGENARSGTDLEGDAFREYCEWFLDKLEGGARKLAAVR